MKFLRLILFIVFPAFLYQCKSGEIDPVGEGEGETENTIFTFPDSKGAETFDGKVVTEWNSQIAKLIQNTPGYSVPVAARSLAYVQLALYESTFYGVTNKQSLKGQISSLETLPLPENGKEYNWGLAANAAQYTIVRELFASSGDVLRTRTDTLRRQLENELKRGLDEDVIERSIRFGASIANAVWEMSKKTHGHQAYLNNFPNTYVRKGGAGSWLPTSSQRIPLLADWGKTTLLVKETEKEEITAGPVFSFEGSSPYFDQMAELYLYSKKLTEEEKAIAIHWLDGTQSFTSVGHHLLVVNSIAKKENLNMAQMILLNTQLGLAMHDAAVLSMRCKYTTDLMRPVSYIKQAIDPAWKSSLPDDSTPEFTSLPATLAGVVVELLNANFGEEYVFQDETYAIALGKRSYSNFEEYGLEASNAAFYAGNHLKNSCEKGYEQGRKVMSRIQALEFNKEVM